MNCVLLHKILNKTGEFIHLLHFKQ